MNSLYGTSTLNMKQACPHQKRRSPCTRRPAGRKDARLYTRSVETPTQSARQPSRPYRVKDKAMRGRAQERPRHHTPQAGNANPTQAPPGSREKRVKVRGCPHRKQGAKEERPGLEVPVARARGGRTGGPGEAKKSASVRRTRADKV